MQHGINEGGGKCYWHHTPPWLPIFSIGLPTPTSAALLTRPQLDADEWITYASGNTFWQTGYTPSPPAAPWRVCHPAQTFIKLTGDRRRNHVPWSQDSGIRAHARARPSHPLFAHLRLRGGKNCWAAPSTIIFSAPALPSSSRIRQRLHGGTWGTATPALNTIPNFSTILPYLASQQGRPTKLDAAWCRSSCKFTRKE